jgi:hypothetical protein
MLCVFFPPSGLIIASLEATGRSRTKKPVHPNIPKLILGPQRNVRRTLTSPLLFIFALWWDACSVIVTFRAVQVAFPQRDAVKAVSFTSVSLRAATSVDGGASFRIWHPDVGTKRRLLAHLEIMTSNVLVRSLSLNMSAHEKQEECSNRCNDR